MALTYSSLTGGSTDEGAELIASFNYDTVGKKVEAQFASGDYLVTLYGPNSSNVRIYTSDINGNGALLTQLDITESGQVQIITLPANIIRLLVIGSSKGSIVIRKMSDAASGTLNISPDVSSWSMQNNSVTQLVGCLDNNGDTVIGSRTGGSSNLYFVSSDGGQSWTEYSNLPSSKSDSAIVYSSGSWVIATENTGAFYYRRSTDNGVTWSDASYNYNGYGNIGQAGMASDGSGTIIAVSKQYGVYASFRSTNGGASWNFYALPNNNNNYAAISYAGGWWFAPGFQGNNLAFSTNGVSWSNLTTGVPNRGGVVGHKDGTYYLPNGGSPGLGGGSSSTIHVSTDPGQGVWTTRSLPISAYWGVCSVIGDDIILSQHSTGGNYPGEILTSTDGITWTRRTAPDAVVARFIKPPSGTIIGGAYQTGETNRILQSGSSYEVI